MNNKNRTLILKSSQRNSKHTKISLKYVDRVDIELDLVKKTPVCKMHERRIKVILRKM